MSIKVALEHRTTYRFDRPIAIGPHVIRLRPAPHARTPIESYALTISPADHFINWQQDPFGNHLARVVFPTKSAELDITVGLVADMAVINPFDFFVEDYAERYPFTYPAELAADLQPYLEIPESARGPRLDEWLAALPTPGPEGQLIIPFLSGLNAAVNADVAYSTRMEAGVQTPDQTLDGPDRLLPRLRLAAGQRPAPLRPGRPVRVRLPGPARSRRGTIRGFPRGRRTSPTCMPGPRCTSPARAGSGSTPPPPCTRGRVTSRSPLRHTRPRRRRSPGRPSCPRRPWTFANSVRRIHEDPRVTRPYTDGAGRAPAAAGSPRRRSADRSRHRADHGRRTDLRLGGRPDLGPVDDRRGRAGEAGAGQPARRRRWPRSSPRAGWSSAARASGIPARRSRAGRSA